MPQLLFCFCCSLLCGYYLRGTTIRGGLLFKGEYYSRGNTIQGGLQFKGDYYSRGTTIQGGLLFKDTHTHTHTHSVNEAYVDPIKQLGLPKIDL